MPKSKDINLREIAVLIKIYHGEKSITPIARELMITIQGVRYYINDFLKKGFINENMEITKVGVEFIQKNLSWMKDFIADDIDELYVGTKWEAIADDPIKTGQKISVYMQDGYLHASGKLLSTPKANATNDAQTGMPVIVDEIDGLIEIKSGSVDIYYLKEESIRNFAQSTEKIKKIIYENQGATIGIVGETIKTVFSTIKNVKPLEFSAIEGAFESSIRGLNSIVFMSEFRLNFSYGVISKLKLKFKDVKIQIISL
ncbi:MAG: hypothetical protein ACYDAO_09610 [Thermoplasmataceae archaeon]